MKIYGQIEQACLEQLSSDPIASTQGRIYQNTTTGKTILDDGVNKRALLRNDDKMVIGSDGTAANNVRLHKATAGLLQNVLATDTTADGSLSNSIAQSSTRDENQLNAALPANGNPGRSIFVTDQKVIADDDGTNWRKIIPEYSNDDSTAGSTIQLATITSSVVRLTGSFTTLNMIPAGFNSQRVTLINRTGADVSISHNSGATAANRIFTGTGANVVLKNNASIPLYYDLTTARWQVTSEVSGASAGGGAIPNSVVVTATSAYTVLSTDDVILCDSSSGPFSVTLPNPVGNLGKVITFEKIGGIVNSVVTLLGTINGVVNEELWALNVPHKIVSNGAAWKTISEPGGVVLIAHRTAPFSVAALNKTTNVSLETLSAATANNIDNAIVKTGNIIALFGQSAPEENGIYTVPATNITINGTATANENISTIVIGTTLSGGHICSNNDKISLRNQTISSENGIYVVTSATPGTTVRDTSLRHPSYVTPQTLSGFIMYVDWYNFPAASLALAPTEPGGSPVHVNDRSFFAQTNNYLTTFASASLGLAGASLFLNLKVPSNVQEMTLEICPFGGAGGGGQAAVSGSASYAGGGGAGAIPFIISRRLAAGSTMNLQLPMFAPPGSGNAGLPVGSTAGAITASFVSDFGFAPTVTVASAAAGASVTGGAPFAGYVFGGPNHYQGGGNSVAGQNNYFVTGGSAGPAQGSFLGGGGGGAGITAGSSGSTGISASGSLAAAGGGTGAPGAFGAGAGGGGSGNIAGSGRAGRGGFGGPGYIRIVFK